MLSNVFNNMFNTCSSYGKDVYNYCKPLVSKTAEIAQKCFKSMGQLALGFCLGTAATACYMIFGTAAPAGYSLDLGAVAVCAVAMGIFVGVSMAVSFWKGETV